MVYQTTSDVALFAAAISHSDIDIRFWVLFFSSRYRDTGNRPIFVIFGIFPVVFLLAVLADAS